MSFSPPVEAKILDVGKISLRRDSSGTLRVKIEGETQEYPVKPIRYFPFTEEEYYVGLFRIDKEGAITKEIALISDLKRLSEKSRILVEEELNKASPLISIKKIISINQVRKILRWQVKTLEGEMAFEVHKQSDIGIVSPMLISVQDINGNTYKIDLTKLDSNSQSLLEIYI